MTVRPVQKVFVILVLILSMSCQQSNSPTYGQKVDFTSGDLVFPDFRIEYKGEKKKEVEALNRSYSGGSFVIWPPGVSEATFAAELLKDRNTGKAPTEWAPSYMYIPFGEKIEGLNFLEFRIGEKEFVIEVESCRQSSQALASSELIVWKKSEYVERFIQGK